MVQQVVSLLLIVHLFTVAVALSAYTRRSLMPRRSPLHDRLLQVLAPYARTLNLAPASAPYHLTQYDALTGESEQDDEFYLELEITDANGETVVHRLNELGAGVPESHHRYRRYAADMAWFLSQQRDVEVGEFALAAASLGLRHWGADSGVLRLKHHLSQPRSINELREGFPADPLADPYKITVYEADVLLDDEGVAQVIKRESKGQVAPVRSGN